MDGFDETAISGITCLTCKKQMLIEYIFVLIYINLFAFL